jgi:hypothetical protein
VAGGICLRMDGASCERRAFSLGQPVLPATPARRRPFVVLPSLFRVPCSTFYVQPHALASNATGTEGLAAL